MNVLMEKRNAVKRLVFKREGLSRREISECLNLDVRTVSGYLDELTKRGLLQAKPEIRGKRGRPTIFYYPNNCNILYPGLFVSSSGIRGVLVDLNGESHYDEVEIQFTHESKLTFFNKIMRQCAELVDRVRGSGKHVGGIGVAYSRWLQPPISEYEIFSHLFDTMAARFKAPVYKTSPINALMYKIKNLNDCEDNIAIVNPGHILELGVMLENSIPDNLDSLEYDFQHFSAFPDGDLCYCGKRGCLENGVVRGGLLDMINRSLPSGEKLEGMGGFMDLVAAGDAAAVGVLDSAAKGLAAGLIDLKRELDLTRIYFCTSGNRSLYQKTVEYMEDDRGKEASPEIEEVPVEKMSVPKAAGNMAAYLTVKHHILS